MENEIKVDDIVQHIYGNCKPSVVYEVPNNHNLFYAFFNNEGELSCYIFDNEGYAQWGEQIVTKVDPLTKVFTDMDRDLRQLISAAATSDKILAIKYVRNNFALPLSEAKRFVEEFCLSLNQE